MAFVSSFTVNSVRQQRAVGKCSTRRICVRASAKDGEDDDDSQRFPPLGPHFNHSFHHFDGSKPLLPPWRPASLEDEFGYTASRIESREREKPSFRRIVKVEKEGFATMFAEVVQEPNDERGRMWLRPLLLSSHLKDTAVDLRGATDVVLDKKCVSEVDSETRLRLSVNLIATEHDVVGRVLSDERWDEVGTNAVLSFMKRLSEGDGPC
ncbi:hypothetical protein FGB62_128g014 [Gracilaria domingensis]|nr:hypothetical protein FGB62_128g014 [Gracilaria domingensis]